MSELRLTDNSKVAIIGGGPAGSFFALYLLHFAEQKGIRPQIIIYQERNFTEGGPKGCKGCAGVLSFTLMENLKELGLQIPEHVIRSRIEQYAVHSPYTSISISKPEQQMQIISIYRGNGPRVSNFSDSISFDGWLLGETRKLGVRIEERRVNKIDLRNATVETEYGKSSYDLIVLATGVNTKPVRIVGSQYTAPEVRTMAQDELFAGAAAVESHLGSMAHAFLLPGSGLIFGTLVPKGEFINVSVLGTGKQSVSVNDFLNNELVKGVLPRQYSRACGCRPRAVIGPARHYYADRFVVVGDATVTRLYKDGVGSALLTARQAARTAVDYGISCQDFEKHYQSLCDSINADNRWGRLLFALNDRVKDSRALFHAIHRLVGDEQEDPGKSRPFTRSAWGMLTASYSYRKIARMSLNPISSSRFISASTVEYVSERLRKEARQTKRLHVGSRKVLILGSGFGGTYALRRLVPSLNRNENVETTMVSDENFLLFSPLLHEVAMGGIETRHIAYPIRRLHWRDRFNFVQATVEKIDLNNRKVVTSMGILGYDYLILALGSVTNLTELESMGKNVFVLKTLKDSMLIRNHIIEVFEKASVEKDEERQKQLLTFVVGGAGYTGVQLVTELRDFVCKGLLRFYKTVKPADIRIVLVEAAPKIVGELHTRLGRHVMDYLWRLGIEVRLKSRITRIWEDCVEVTGIDGIETLPAGTLIWTAGVVANPRIAELPVERDSIGRVVVNEFLEIPGVPGVYAIGDCAHYEDPRTGQPAPPRAHHAVRQAKVAARNILAEIRGRDRQAYHYSNEIEAVSLGVGNAVFRYRGLRLYGFPARLLWIVGYSLLVTGHYNRVRIVMDWILTWLFGRDTTLLKLVKLE
ncbi:MAG: FAD-dependent oxidoreductase [Chloroflexi bacterium]|nr:FAD-dependent oxidoreductase [Chloroflexota bacterium]